MKKCPYMLLSALLALLLFFTSSCARRGPLRAPEEVRPAPIGDLAARWTDGQLELQWSRPNRSETGRRVEEIAIFIIEHQCIGRGDPEFSVAATVTTGERGRFRRVKSYRYRRDVPTDWLPCRYRIVSKTYDGYVSEPSNTVEVTQ